MNIIVSILSEQLIPNLLFIKQVSIGNEFHVFLTTQKMESRNKSTILADSLGLQENRYQTLVIDPNSPLKILEQLNHFHWDRDAKYLVNITGGTKMMSQMTHSFFKDHFNAEIYYWPLEFNYLEQLHPTLNEIHFKTSIELDLKTYLAAHGYQVTSQNKLSYAFNRSNELFMKVVSKEDSGLVNYIKNAQSPKYNNPDKNYLIGGWFEEWLYETLRTEIRLVDSQIAFNLKLKNRFSARNTESDNEIDIAFVYLNKLYIIECKVFSKNQLSSKKINETIYKISSIKQSMGIQAIAIVCILSDFGHSKARSDTISYLSGMAQIGKVFSLKDMKNKVSFLDEIKRIIRYTS